MSKHIAVALCLALGALAGAPPALALTTAAIPAPAAVALRVPQGAPRSARGPTGLKYAAIYKGRSGVLAGVDDSSGPCGGDCRCKGAKPGRAAIDVDAPASGRAPLDGRATH